MSESRGCRGLWRRRPEGWGQTHRQRLAVSFSLSFGALLLVCLAVVYVSQYRFLYRTVRRTLHRFTTEFQFEYICQREEPRGGRPLSVSSLPLPGAVGVTEGGFSVLFQGLFPSALLGCAMILSRLASFYVPLVVSGLGFLTMKNDAN